MTLLNLHFCCISERQHEHGQIEDRPSSFNHDTPFVPSSEAQKLIQSYSEVAKASVSQMNQISQKLQNLHQLTQVPWASNDRNQPEAILPPDTDPNKPASTSMSHAIGNSENFNKSFAASGSSLAANNLADLPSQFTATAASMNLTLPADKNFANLNVLANSKNTEGLTVVTLGHLQPKNMSTSYTPSNEPSQSGQPSTSATASDTPSDNTMRVHRKTFIPGWSVPPRVLLVDDDSVCRNLSSKLLQVFGCTFDVATDGVEALKKLGLEKYDLVLMVSQHSCMLASSLAQPIKQVYYLGCCYAQFGWRHRHSQHPTI
jgi:CheY-like chemotaxis protein